MAKAGAPPKDADQLAAADYGTLPQPEPEPADADQADAPPLAGDGGFTWQNDRDKALLAPDAFGKKGKPLYGDAGSPVFQITFDREHLAPPPAKVMAKDRENAWAKYRRVMGIITTEHEPTITELVSAPAKASARE